MRRKDTGAAPMKLGRVTWRILNGWGEPVAGRRTAQDAVALAEETGIGAKITSVWLGKRSVFYVMPIEYEPRDVVVEKITKRLAEAEKTIKATGAIYKERSYLRSRKWADYSKEHDLG